MTRYIAVWLVGTEYCNYCRGPARKQQLRNSDGGPMMVVGASKKILTTSCPYYNVKLS